MKIRSLTTLLALAVIAGSAMAGEAVHRLSRGQASQPSSVAPHLAMGDVQPLTALYVPDGQLAAVDMPDCNICH